MAIEDDAGHRGGGSVGCAARRIRNKRGLCGSRSTSGSALLLRRAGSGVGTALMRAGEEWARANGAERMELGLDAANAGRPSPVRAPGIRGPRALDGARSSNPMRGRATSPGSPRPPTAAGSDAPRRARHATPAPRRRSRCADRGPVGSDGRRVVGLARRRGQRRRAARDRSDGHRARSRSTASSRAASSIPRSSSPTIATPGSTSS